jgi:long-chain fatty acid transport protein
VLAAALGAALLTPCTALGAGYGIYEQGAAVLGMAGAATASVHDGSAEFYNPAALVRLEGRQVYAGGTWLSTHISFAGVDPFPGYGVTEAMKSGSFFPPQLYWTNRPGKNWAYGVGVNAPFGLGIEWENPLTFTGRTHATKATLRTINANLSFAYAFNDAFSVGLGYNAMFAGVELNQVRTQVIPGGGGGTVNVANVKLKSSLKPGYGINGSLLWTPKVDWKFAFAYRAKVDVDVTGGDATFTQIGTGNPALDAAVAAGLPPAQKVDTKLHFPAILSFGAAWNPAPAWTWELDGNLTQWSAFDNLPIDFKGKGASDTTFVENYDDSWRIGIGAEHRLPAFTYRFGYYFDKAAAPTESVTPLLPDASRHGVTVGLGWQLGAKKAWNLDLYNLALFVEKRSTENKVLNDINGTYKSYVNGAGASLAYHW